MLIIIIITRSCLHLFEMDFFQILCDLSSLIWKMTNNSLYDLCKEVDIMRLFFAQNMQLAKCKKMESYALQKGLAMALWADR